MKLGILLASPPELPDLKAVYQVAVESVTAQEAVFLYLIDDGIRNLDQPEIAELRDRGIKLFACAYAARKRGIELDHSKAIFSGLTILLDMINSCDHFFTFTSLGSSSRLLSASFPRMMSQILIRISEDPQKSHRPAEAVRIAAGVGGWKDVEVNIILNGPASYILSPDTDEFVDSENYSHYLPIIARWQRPVYLAPDAEVFQGLKDSETGYQQCDSEKIDALQQDATCFIPF